MGLATLLAVVGCLCILVACAAMSTDASVVRRTAWVRGEDREHGEVTVYLGLSTVVMFDGSKKLADVKWRDIDCDSEVGGDSCEPGCDAVVFNVTSTCCRPSPKLSQSRDAVPNMGL